MTFSRTLRAGILSVLAAGTFAAAAGLPAAVRADTPVAAAALFPGEKNLPDLPPAVMDTWMTDAAALKPALKRIAGAEKASVLFLGGSITQNPGWQNKVGAVMTKAFPKVRFTFKNIGVGSLGSNSHVFRWRTHGKGITPDLIFFESAVNDARSPIPLIKKAYEGTIRGLRKTYPEAGIVLLHFADPGNVRACTRGSLPEHIAVQSDIGKHYGLPQIYLCREVADRIAAKQFSWKKDFKDLHPAPFGQRLYGNAVFRLFRTALSAPDGSSLKMPEKPLTADCWTDGDYIPGAKAYDLNRTEKVSDWVANRTSRRFYTHCPALVAKGNGASFSMDFRGRLMGIYVIAGPRSAPVEWSVDGSEWKTVRTFTRLSNNLCMPWPYILTETLSDGKHTAEFRVKAEGNHDTLVLYALMVLGAQN